MSLPTIVVGGGLSGLSAAHTILQNGGKVVLIEKNLFMGGNSTKATSGINGAGTRTQKQMGIPDTKESFEEDTIRSATGIKEGKCPNPYELGTVLTHNSAEAVHWIQDKFGLALDTVSRLGGHSHPRTHRSAAGTTFPGMEITFRLMTTFEEICKNDPERAKLITKAPVKKLIVEGGRVIGVEYEKNGKIFQEFGNAVVVASGGYAAGGLFPGSLLDKVRPDLMTLPTTNGEHCTGDGIVFCQEIGAGAVDLKHVQVHPTGLVSLDDPENRVKFLAAEALRGEGGIMLDREGKRFCNDLGTRDYCSERMWEHNKPPYRLVLNSAASSGIAWHCKHYCGRRVMKHFKSGQELAKDIGISVEQLKASFDEYNNYAKNKNDPWGKKFFKSVPFNINDEFYVAVITPIVHYSMGGVEIDGKARVLYNETKQPIPGLFAAGEVTGGVHGKNRLGGSALLECVVYGRVAGNSVIEYVKNTPPVHSSAPSGHSSVVTISIPQPSGPPITISVSGSGIFSQSNPVVGHSSSPQPSTQHSTTSSSSSGSHSEGKEYTLEEVSKHNKEKDLWLVVNDKVLDVTKFLNDHPGGKMPIMSFAGRDATEEFNMVHEPGVIEKYTPESIIGKLKPRAKL